MKKLFLFSLLFVSISVYAQTEKNKIFLSGATNTSLLFSNTEDSDNKTTNINISPAVGYFVTNNFVMGISGLYNRSTLQYSYYEIIISNTYNYTSYN